MQPVSCMEFGVECTARCRPPACSTAPYIHPPSCPCFSPCLSCVCSYQITIKNEGPLTIKLMER